MITILPPTLPTPESNAKHARKESPVTTSASLLLCLLVASFGFGYLKRFSLSVAPII